MITLPLHPKLQDFVTKLCELMVFISPEYRSSIIPVEEYEPNGQEGLPVQAVIIGRLAAFPVYQEGPHGAYEVIRVEEIDPNDTKDDSLIACNGSNYANATFVIHYLITELIIPVRQKHERSRG